MDSGTGFSSHGPNATSFHCSNFSGVSATLRFLVRDKLGILKGNQSIVVPDGRTVTVSTQDVVIFDDTALFTNKIEQGLGLIQSTQSAVVCSAMIVARDAFTPEGIDLHMARFRPNAGSEE